MAITNDEFSVDVPYRVKFTNEKPIPIEKFVESLVAYEKLIKRSYPFLEIACPAVDVIEIEVMLSRVESGSLTEDFLVRIVFKTKENYENAKEVAAVMFENNNKVITSAVCLGVAAYIGFGVHKAMQPGVPSTNIQAYNGAVVQLGGTMNISDKSIEKILNRISDKKQLAKEAISAISPAQLEKNASIEMNETEQVKIKPEFIIEAPTEYPEVEHERENEVLTKTEIEIWASDRESHTKSWAGTVPGLVDKRTKFVLDENVNPNDLHGSRKIIADIVIVREFSPSKKEFIPKKVEILKIRKP